MYFFEWFTWKVKIAPAFKKNNFTMASNEFRSKKAALYENDILADQQASKLCASQTPRSRGPMYAYNARFIEMRGGFFETHRGYVTILSIAILSFIGQLTLGISEILLIRWHAIPKGTESGFDYGIITLAFFISLDLLLIVVYCKYGLFISRMELFTSRHLLIRFNRKTQQVYLHRPKYCGGITVLPWEGIMSEGSNAAPSDTSGLDIPLILSWSAETTKTFNIECAAVGKRGNNMAELRDEWEFIRRYMDEGPEGLPRPHITSHFPWPWQAFIAPLEGLGQYLVNSNKTIKWGLFFLWPAILLFGFAHWISLLLCWKPRWPKVIREAGLPGKPVPPLTTLEDYPPHIQQRLRANAHIWAAKPGSPPEKKPRTPRAKRTPRVPQADAES